MSVCIAASVLVLPLLGLPSVSSTWKLDWHSRVDLNGLI